MANARNKYFDHKTLCNLKNCLSRKVLESSSVIIPYFHKPNLVDLSSFSGVLFTSLLLLILDIGEDIVTLKISLDNLNERSV